MIPYRAYYASSYYWKPLSQIPAWLVHSRELTNFSYDVTTRSKDYTASVAALLTGCEWPTARSYISELDQEIEELRSHLAHGDPKTTSLARQGELRPGRRLIHYALIRALKPRLVVEAGTSRGLGTCIMAAALRRNLAEGFMGRIVSLDVDPLSGSMIRPPYAEFAELRIGDCRKSLERLHEPVDLFIHDTSHLSENKEYAIIENLLSDGGIVLSTWHTETLMKFARGTGRNYIVLRDEPLDSWYPGTAMGIAFCAPHLSAGAISRDTAACSTEYIKGTTLTHSNEIVECANGTNQEPPQFPRRRNHRNSAGL